MADHDRLARLHGLEAVSQTSGGPETDADEKIEGTFADVALVLGDKLDKGSGKLFITTRQVVWYSSQDTSLGLAAAFHNITLHAVSQADDVYHKPCIYMQMQENESDDGLEDAPEDEEEAPETSPELRLVPSDSSQVQQIFTILSDCAALNPDDGSDDDGEEEFCYDEDEVAEGADREAMLDHLDSLIQMPRAAELDDLLAEDPSRFEDADGEREDPEPNGRAH